MTVGDIAPVALVSVYNCDNVIAGCKYIVRQARVRGIYLLFYLSILYGIYC